MKKVAIWGMVLVVWAMADSPKETAERFWEAWKAGRMAQARAMTVRETVPRSDLPVKVTIEAVVLKHPVVSQWRASVPTIVRFRPDLNGTKGWDCNATFETALLEVGGGWRIDGVVTMDRFDQAVTDASIACSMGKIEDVVGTGVAKMKAWLDTLEKQGDEWQKALQKAIESLEKEWPPPADEQKRPTLPPADKGERI
jgi:hypothetical protein